MKRTNSNWRNAVVVTAAAEIEQEVRRRMADSTRRVANPARQVTVQRLEMQPQRKWWEFWK